MIEVITALIANPLVLAFLALLNLIPAIILSVLFVMLMRRMDSQTEAFNALLTQNKIESERVKTLMDLLISKIK